MPERPQIITVSPCSLERSESKYYLPDAYNTTLEFIPPDWWICVVDSDVMLPVKTFHVRLLSEAIEKMPAAGMFTAMTNRLWRPRSAWQMVGPELEWETDIKAHLLKGWEMATHIGSRLKDVTDIEEAGFKPTSGFFQAFKSETWKKIAPIQPPLREVDWEIHRRIRALGMRIFLIEGLYVFHYSHYDKDLLGLVDRKNHSY